jgi:large subunit ribosomal protein L15
MVVRRGKKNRKYFGTRRWGVGNIKNARGKGCRGGVGNAGRRKSKWTRMTAKTPEIIKKIGFTPWDRTKLKEITLKEIDKMARASKEEKFTLELSDCKVLSNGTLSRPVVVKASGFSKHAAEKIKSAGGDAIVI